MHHAELTDGVAPTGQCRKLLSLLRTVEKLGSIMVPGCEEQSVILFVPGSVSKTWQSLQDTSPTSIPDAGSLSYESQNMEVVSYCLVYFSLSPGPGSYNRSGAGSE